MKIRFTFLMAFCLMAFFASAQVVDVLTGLNRPWSLALRNNELFIAEDGTGKIIKADISQPIPTAVDVLTGLGNTPFGGMRMKEDEIFFAIYNQGVIRKFDVTQPTPTVVDVATGIPTTYIADILIDGDFLYAANARTTGTAGNSFFRIDLSQTPATIETIFVGHPQLGLAKSGNILYFSEGTQNSPTGDIYKLDLSQPTPTPQLVVSVPTAYGLTLNGGFLYVSRSGAVSRVDLSQPNPTYEDVATGIGNTRLCAFDGLDLYISIFATQGKVVKLGISQPVFPSQPTVCGNTVPTDLGGASPTGGIYSGPGVTDNGDGSTFSFNPTAAGGPGIYTVTYTAVNGTQVTSTLTVAAPPVIGAFGFNTDVAFPPAPLPDPNGGPSGGVYSGPGMLAGNIFDAGLAGVGVHVLTYTFTDANGCTGTGTGNINVNPAPNDDCSGASNINNLFGGAFNVPQTSSLQDNTGYTSNGDPAVSSGCFYQDDAVQHSAWYSFTGDGNTYRLRSVQCSATSYIPNGDTQVAIFTGSCGSPTQVACNDDENGNAGILNFSVDITTQVGQTYRMFVDGYGGLQGEFCLEVTNLSQTAISIPSLLGTVCSNEGALIGGATPTGGVYSGPGVFDSGNGTSFIFNPFAVGGPGNYTVTYTLPNGSSATATVTVTAAPVIGVFGFITDVVTPPSLLSDPSSGPAGGVYSGVGVLPGNLFDAALAGAGVHLLTYTFTDANGCTGTGTGTITVNQVATLPADDCATANDINSLFGAAYNVPQTSALQNNTGYTSTGDPAVSSGCFFNNDAVQSSIWYSFTGDGNTYRIRSVQCSATNYIPDGDTQVAIFIGSCASPTQVACNDDENGNAGILNFNVAITTQSGQTYWVLVDGYNGAQGQFCLEVTNLSQTAISFPALGTVCSNVTATLGGATPTGGVYSGPGVTNNGNGNTFSFNPTAAGGPGTYTVIYTLPNGSSATATVTVTAAPVINFNPPTPVSISAGTQLLNALPAGGTYAGPGVSGNSFNPAAAGVGAHTITYTFTDANGCTGTGTGTITVNQAATLPADDCADAKDINNLFGGAFNVQQTSALQNNTGYTSNGDPAVASGCFFQNDAVQSSIWYTFTGDGNTYRIRSVQCSATNYIPDGDTQVAIFTGSCASPMQVACNDDENGNANILNFSVDIATQSGQIYWVLVDGYGGAQGEFCLEVTNLTPSAVTDIGKTDIRLFPNPTMGVVKLSGVDADQVQVFDNMGRLILQVVRPGNSIDFSDAPAGIYLLKITKGEAVYSARVVKE